MCWIEREQRWFATVTKSGRRVYQKTFKSKHEAAAAVIEARLRHHTNNIRDRVNAYD